MDIKQLIEEALEETIKEQDKQWNVINEINNRQDTNEPTWQATKKRNREWLNILKTGGTETGPTYPEKIKTDGHMSAPPMEENYDFDENEDEGEELDEMSAAGGVGATIEGAPGLKKKRTKGINTLIREITLQELKRINK